MNDLIHCLNHYSVSYCSSSFANKYFYCEGIHDREINIDIILRPICPIWISRLIASMLGLRLSRLRVRGCEPLFCTEEWLPSLVFDWCFSWRLRIPVFIAVFNNVKLYYVTQWYRPQCKRYSNTYCFGCLSVIFVKKCLCLHLSYKRTSVFLSY